MTSIPLAMTWELIRRCRNALALSFLWVNLFCSLLMSALRSNGPVDLSDPSMTSFQLGMILLSIFGIGAAILSVHTETSRIAVLPVDTWTIVTWRMLPAMALLSGCMVLNALFINLIFDVRWPMLWPALFAPVGLAMLQASLWISEKSPLQIVSVAIAGGIFGIWFFLRFRSVFVVTLHPLMILLEAIPLVVMAFVAHRVAILGVSRLRCGESLLKSRWDELFTAMNVDMAHLQLGNPRPAPVFKSAAEAQFWFEWRKKGWALPSVVTAALVFQSVAWVIFERDFHKLTIHILVGGVVLSVSAMLAGLIIGNFGRADASIEMGHFLASRPMASRELARVMLKVMARVNVTSWGIYLVFCAIIASALVVTRNTQELFKGPLSHWWCFPAILLLEWAVTGVFATMYMTGRQTFLAWLICGCIAVYLSVMAGSFMLDAKSKQQLFSITQLVTGIVMVTVTGGVFYIAQLHKLFSNREWAIAGTAWLGISSITAFEVLRNPEGSIPMAILLVGVGSLCLFPFAAAPLALSWNRHR